MAGRFVCVECGFECPEKPDLEAHWGVEEHGPRDVQKLGIARARGDAPSEVPTEAGVRQAARRRVNDAVSHRRRLRALDGGRR